MRLTLTTLTLAALAAAPALAEGDATKGAQVFKQCQTCHTIVDKDGNKVAGNGAKTGPNLYGVSGRTAGTYEGFKYGDSMVAAGQKGLAWNEADFTKYVQGTTEFLKDYLADPKAKGKMTFKVKSADDAADVWAYLVSVGPAPAN